jgi:nicotinamidase-related amidase
MVVRESGATAGSIPVHFRSYLGRGREADAEPDIMTTALIIGDIQRGITGAYPFARQVVAPLTDLLPRARSAGVLVVFVRIAFRVNRADLPSGNALFETFFEAADIFHEGAAGTEIDLPVQAEDVLVLKRRASAFAGTDLDLVLRARAVDSIAVAGVATSAMVAATCYDAADRGYRVTVLRDGCADGDPSVHDFFMDKVFPGRAFEVVPCAGWPGSGGTPAHTKSR